MAGADDNAILAGRGGGARMRRYEANGVKGTNIVSTTHSKRENGRCQGTAKDRAGPLYALSARSACCGAIQFVREQRV